MKTNKDLSKRYERERFEASRRHERKLEQMRERRELDGRGANKASMRSGS